MIRPEQLAQALDRIHPRDRELLSLSLRRRVPDEALGRLYECEPTEVARRRARAIEKLADELELQRGEDLGAVLKALLEAETWSAVAATVGDEFAVSAGGGRLTAVPPPDDAEIKASGPALAPVPAQAEEEAAEAEKEAAPEAPADASGNGTPAAEEVAAPAPSAPEAEPPEARAAGGPSRREGEPPEAPLAQPAGAAPQPAAAAAGEPVLEMLAAREAEASDAPKRTLPVALFGLGIASLVGAAGVVGATQFGDTSTRIVQSGGGGGDDGTRHFIPDRGGPLAAPFPTDPKTVSCYSTAGGARSDRAPPRARRRQASEDHAAHRVGLAARARRGGAAGRLARRAGAGAPQRRDRVDAARPGADGLRQLVAPRGPLQAQAARTPGREDDPQDEDRDRQGREPHAEGPLQRDRQAARHRQGLALRLLRARPDRPPDPACRTTGPAATASPCTPRATSRASDSR